MWNAQRVFICNYNAFLVKILSSTLIYELRDEKPCFVHMRKHVCRSAAQNRTSDQRLYFRYIDKAIPLLPIFEIASLKPSSVVAQPGLCQTWSESPMTDFYATLLIGIYNFVILVSAI